MLKYPDTQSKAQAELDLVLGHGILPTFDDEENLPYLAALVKECLRWEAVTPIAVPHVLTEDDIYNGFYIPSGTVVAPNVWSVTKFYFYAQHVDYISLGQFYATKKPILNHRHLILSGS